MKLTEQEQMGLWQPLSGGKRATLFKNPGSVVAVTFALMILGGTALLLLPAASRNGTTGIVDALFTATSAVCVTGLTVVDTGSHFSGFGHAVILALIQAGGLGIMVFSAFLMLLAGGRLSMRNKMVMEESYAQQPARGMRRLLGKIVLWVAGIEAAGALLFFASLGNRSVQDIFPSIFHSVSAFCNAGFSLYADSFVSHCGSIHVNVLLMALVFMGGIGFFALVELREKIIPRLSGKVGKDSRFSLHTKVVLVTSAALVLAGGIMIFALEAGHALRGMPLWEKGLSASFLSVSSRTAGFNTVDTGGLTHATLLFVMFLMFVGGSPGSTAGGIKTSTFAVIAILVISRLQGQKSANLFERRLQQNTIEKAITLGGLAVAFVMVVSLLVLFFERSSGTDGIKLLFETVSAFGTVGLSAGVTPGLTIATKLLLTFTMFCGRIGPLTLGIMILRKQEKVKFEYPEENVIIG